MAISNLNSASDIAITAALNRLKSSLGSNGSWVPSTNRYVINTIDVLKADIKANTVNNQDLVDYIATSSVIHCFNSWSYLTAAVNSYLEGDYSNAVHNAYYCELRAIMSFLAAQGIGVFSGFHIIVDSAGLTSKAILTNGEGNTHTFAKVALDQWLGDNSNTNKLLNLVKVRGFPLDKWLINAGFSSQLTSLSSSDLLRKWSIDISIIGKEHDLRNFVSYRPQNFDVNIVRPSDDIKNRLNTVLDIWDICEPNRFFEIILLRKMLDDLTYSQYHQKYSDESDVKIKKLLIDMGINPTDQGGNYLVDFLKRRHKNPDNNIFNLATAVTMSVPILERDNEPTGILSRACLLLLTITNCIETLLQNSTVTRRELDLWHNNLGSQYGYWIRGNEPTLFSDLWIDVEEEIVKIYSWINRPGINPTVFSFKNEMKEYSTSIRHINRSYFWNTGQ